MQQKQIPEELTRVTECKIGAVWHLNTELPISEVMNENYWVRFKERQVRAADEIRVTAKYAVLDDPNFEKGHLVVRARDGMSGKLTVEKT